MSAPGEWPLVRRTWRALGGAAEIILALDDADRRDAAGAALDAAQAQIAAFEARCSRFLPTSELSALNRAAGTWFAASDDLFAVVAAALRWAGQTGGLFDPTLLGTLAALGYDRDFSQIAHRAVTAPLSVAPPDRPPLGTFRRVRLDQRRHAVWLPSGVGIDLGGIGKGWAADQVLAGALAAWPNALVNLGGDLALRGGPAQDLGWVIGARDPRVEDAPEPVYLGGARLRRGGVATSGAAWRWWIYDGVVRHHLIDPRTGRPATTVAVAPEDPGLERPGHGEEDPGLERPGYKQPDLAERGRPLAVTALAESATAAEVLAKHALLLGEAAGLAVLAARPDRSGWRILSDGTVQISANLRAYLAAQAES